MSTAPSRPSLEQLLEHTNWVRALAQSLVADPHAAEDVAQQAWTTALERPPAHDGNLKAWWASVVRSAAGRMWRDPSRRGNTGLDPDTLEAAASGETEPLEASELASRMETFQRLAAAVAALPEPYGEAIYLRYFEELAIVEVGRRQGIPEAAAQSRVRRGLEQLRGALQHRLGDNWQARCQVFAVPVAGTTALTSTATSTGLVAALLKSPLAVVVALVATVSLLWWWRQEDPGPVVQRAQTAMAAEEQGTEEPIAATEIQDPGGLERQAMESPEPPSAGFLPSSPDGLQVTVMESSGEPIPFAEVLVLDLGKQLISEDRLLQGYEDGMFGFLSIFGDQYRADAEGRVGVAAPQGAIWLIGSAPQAVGILRDPELSTLAVQGGSTDLVLDPVATIPVLVSDAQGMPLAGAPVCLTGDHRDFGDGMMGAETNADGLAWIKVMPGLVMDLDGRKAKARVRLNILAKEPIELPVDLLDLPRQPLRLQMPETGEMEAWVQDAAGAFVTARHLVALAALKPAPGDGSARRTESYGMARPATNGKAFFPYVALGQELRCMAVDPSWMGAMERDLAGPTSPGERILVKLAPEPQFSFVTGRILNAEGAVARNLAMSVEVAVAVREGVDLEHHAIRTDLEGNFRLRLERAVEEGATRSLTVLMSKTKRKPKRHARVEVPAELALGDTALGDFVLEETPILVRGRVLDVEGRAVASAGVHVRYAGLPEDGFARQRRVQKGAIALASPEDEGGWVDREDLKVHTKVDGGFEIRGIALDRRYQLVVEHARHRRTDVDFELGAEDLVVTMAPQLSVTGKVLVDRGIPKDGLTVRLREVHPRRPGEFFHRGTFLYPDGSFEFHGLDSGEYGLVVTSPFLEEELLVLPMRHMEAALEPYRFADLDLRGLLHAIAVRVTDTGGRPIPDVELRSLGAKFARRRDRQAFPLVSLSPSFSFEVTAEGYRRQIHRGVTSSQELILEKGIPVRILLQNRDILHEDWDLRISLVPDGGTGHHGERRPASLELDGRGVAEADFSWPGRFRLSLGILHARNNDSIHQWVDFEGNEDTDAFQVVDTSTLQEFRFMIDELLLAEAMDRAREVEREWDERNP